MVGIESHRTIKSAINGGFEENTLAMLDSSGLKDSRDVHEDKLSFLEAVRAGSLVSDSPTPPTWKMFDAIFDILRGSNSLELAMASYQMLIDLDKHYARIYLKSSDGSEFKTKSTSAERKELDVVKEAWLPFSFGPDASQGEGDSLRVDSLKFSTLIEEIFQAVNKSNSQLLIKHAENMLLFHYLVSVLETDFLPRRNLYAETLDWVLLRESLLSMLLGSRKLNFKNVVRHCMQIISKRCRQHSDNSLRDLKGTTTVSGSAKTAQDCDVALAFTASQLERKTYIDMERFIALIMEFDVIKKEADAHGLTSRADGKRSPVLDIIVDELTYVKAYLSSFLEVFSDPRWKSEIILQYFSKYCAKTSIRTRRSNDSPKNATFEDILCYFSSVVSTNSVAKKIALEDAQLLLAHGFQAYLSLHRNQKHIAKNTEKIGSSTISQISSGLISAFLNIRKIDGNLEFTPFEKEALFTASTIVAQKS